MPGICPKWKSSRELRRPGTWYPRCASFRTGPGDAPEVYFRIVHVALQDDRDSARTLEQEVEVALAPDAFLGGNTGTIKRLLAPGEVVCAIPRRGRPRPAWKPRIPKVREMLETAMVWKADLDTGRVRNQAEITRREGCSEMWVSQIMRLLRLATEIRDHIRAMPATVKRPAITERALRPILQINDPAKQVARFTRLLEGPSVSSST